MLRMQDKLVLRHDQLQQEINIQSKVIEDARAQAAQQLAINEDELYCQVLSIVEETRRAALQEAESSLRALGNP